MIYTKASKPLLSGIQADQVQPLVPAFVRLVDLMQRKIGGWTQKNHRYKTPRRLAAQPLQNYYMIEDTFYNVAETFNESPRFWVGPHWW